VWFNVDLRSRTPIYEQIKRGIREAILRGKLNEGDTLPSIRDMASSIRVNPNTVARAYRELEMEGIVMAHQGVGYIVIKDKEGIKEFMLEDLKKDFREIVSKSRRAGFSLDEIVEVISKLWNEKK